MSRHPERSEGSRTRPRATARLTRWRVRWRRGASSISLNPSAKALSDPVRTGAQNATFGATRTGRLL